MRKLYVIVGIDIYQKVVAIGTHNNVLYQSENSANAACKQLNIDFSGYEFTVIPLQASPIIRGGVKTSEKISTPV